MEKITGISGGSGSKSSSRSEGDKFEAVLNKHLEKEQSSRGGGESSNKSVESEPNSQKNAEARTGYVSERAALDTLTRFHHEPLKRLDIREEIKALNAETLGQCSEERQNTAEIRAADLSIRQKMHNGFSNTLENAFGVEGREAARWADKVIGNQDRMGAADIGPSGLGFAANESLRNIKTGHYLAAAFNAMALIPIPGAKGAGKAAKEGIEDLVEGFGKGAAHEAESVVAKQADEIVKHTPPPPPSSHFDDLEMRPPQRELDNPPGSKLTPEVEDFVTVGNHGDINSLPLGKHGDADTTLLWTVDDQGAHFVPENMAWDSGRTKPSHTNISDQAYFAGEAWRTGENEITINAGSRAFGYNYQEAKSLRDSGRFEDLTMYDASMQKRYDGAIEYFKSLGFNVNVIPLGGR